MNANLPLSRQSTTILVTFYKYLDVKVDKDGKVNNTALHLISILNSRGYDVRTLIMNTK